MEFLFEFSLVGCIILLVLYILRIKHHAINANSLIKENSFLKDQLTQKESDFISREENFNHTINNLKSNLDLQQGSIKETINELKSKEKTLILDYAELESKFLEESEQRRKILSQKKSSEVRLGSIAETLAPFLDQFEFNPERCVFLGKPIDYISFGSEKITFIEVKSGKSQLNANQRKIRDQIKDNKVGWKEVRIK